MYCNYCGAQIPDGARFCNNCGAPLTGPADRGYNPSQANRNARPTINDRLLAPWEYVFFGVIFSLPVIGFILIVFYSFSERDNLKNFARAFICMLIIGLVFALLLLLTGYTDAFIDVIYRFLGLDELLSS